MKKTPSKPALAWLDSAGIALYLGGMIYLGLQPAATARQQILWIIGAVVAGIGAMSLRHGVASVRTAGLILATWGVFWQLAISKLHPTNAPKTLVLSGLLGLVGMMLLGRAMRLPPWLGTVMGWASVVVLWLSTKFPFGDVLLLGWGLAIVLTLYIPRK